MARSIEETVEDGLKSRLDDHGVPYWRKNERMGRSIEDALSKAPSKSGGPGGNKPDVRCMVEVGGAKVPVMIEVKGARGRLAKYDRLGAVANTTSKGDPSWSNISNYASNGAVHYARAILDHAGDEFGSCLAVGVNGYDDEGRRVEEFEAWWLSRENMGVARRLDGATEAILWDRADLDMRVRECALTDDDRERIRREAEDRIDRDLRDLNQYMHNGAQERDKKGRYGLNLAVSARVPLVCGMIMAGVGVDGEVEPLPVTELRGSAESDNRDGDVLMRKIGGFLERRGLPERRRRKVCDILGPTFRTTSLNERGSDGETILKRLYREVLENVVSHVDPRSPDYTDFTGKLFNVLTEWVDIPDGGANDVVLTPRYVTDLMARLCDVGMDDYVWDYALGTAGFLVSAMRIMLEGARGVEDPAERASRVEDILDSHLVGIEKREDIYVLAVLNVMLMGGSGANVVLGDSLRYSGEYPSGSKREGEPFPATVFLLNPPYSAPGKGLVFAERAMSRMGRGGRAAILIQENAGGGNGQPYAREILKKNSLRAVVHMADIFKGKAGVQTAIYVFDTGAPHDPDREIVFVDMSEDGYTRQNRKKASSATNLRDTDHARERYAEVVDIVLGRRKKTDFYKDGEHVFRACVGTGGDDWTLQQHRKTSTVPTEDDFKRVVEEYLSWIVGAVMRGEITVEEATKRNGRGQVRGV